MVLAGGCEREEQRRSRTRRQSRRQHRDNYNRATRAVVRHVIPKADAKNPTNDWKSAATLFTSHWRYRTSLFIVLLCPPVFSTLVISETLRLRPCLPEWVGYLQSFWHSFWSLDDTCVRHLSVTQAQSTQPPSTIISTLDTRENQSPSLQNHGLMTSTQ